MKALNGQESTANAPRFQTQPPQTSPVRAWIEDLVLPTYLPAPPDKNPMFLEKRVYQGSNGKVYPLPFTDRIAEHPVDYTWKAAWIENEFLRVLVLPQIGGRIHAIQDKSNGYDLIYNQPVIKPALVGLAGPWASGGIEFNWPQHHRPATFLPVDVEIENHADGSSTIWCSDHDPLCRMKGMHGVCLHPGKAYVELKVRAYNRTPLVQTFLWWANLATRVHEAYQSFFPPDVYYVADHARRSTSAYPLATGAYYGVDYAARARDGIPAQDRPSQFLPPHCLPPVTDGTKSNPVDDDPAALPLPRYAPNDLSFYANIPTPCSYMCMGSQEDFLGGYDYRAQAGLIQIADHHIAPGKKQWTWGNHDFGYAWDRNLTDPDAKGEYGPYIELMAGVYTDNQPDFSFLQPGETKTWSQYWYPIQKIGPAQHANLDAALALHFVPHKQEKPALRIGVAVTTPISKATIVLTSGSARLLELTRDLAPDQPLVTQIVLPAGTNANLLRLSVSDPEGKQIISYQPKPRSKAPVPPPASEPPAPRDIRSPDELFLTGLHLDQYRHATRCPTQYWREALRRDPLDARCNNALGLWHLRRGEFTVAEPCFRKAIQRLTGRNANPYDGEPYYNLGLCLRHLGRDDEAYDALYKATWNQSWAGAAYHALAEIDCARATWTIALDHLTHALRFNTDNTRARNLQVMVLRKLGGIHLTEAARLLQQNRALDPLDWWARYLDSQPLACDLQTQLDLAHDFARAGLYAEAVQLLDAGSQANGKPHLPHAENGSTLPTLSWGASPLTEYTLGWLYEKLNDPVAAKRHFKAASELSPDYCFPARLQEIAILQTAIQAQPKDPRAPYYLGNLFYDRRRHEEAIDLWEISARLDPSFSVVWRNLGIGYFNIRKQPAKARQAYEKAFRSNPTDARLLFERDQLWKRLGVKPVKRLRELQKHPAMVQQRDDLSIELCALFNQTGSHTQAASIIQSRRFQPWEGGEGGPLGQHVRSHLALGRLALAAGDAATARDHFQTALTAPFNLGEARHLLANQSDLHFWLGCALKDLGQAQAANEQWLAAATAKGDFLEMSVRTFSEMTYYSALAWNRLGRKAKAEKIFRDLLAYAKILRRSVAKIDYFATSLPTMLLFDDDLQRRQQITAMFLQAQALIGLRRKKQAAALLRSILQRDPNHALAADLIKEVTS